MTKQFFKWVSKQNIPDDELAVALREMADGNYEANLGGNIYKKRIRFKGKGKSGSGRTIICFKIDNCAIYIHGFAKNEKDNLSNKELLAFKELSKILLGLSVNQLETAIKNGDFIEVIL